MLLHGAAAMRLSAAVAQCSGVLYTIGASSESAPFDLRYRCVIFRDFSESVDLP